MAGILGFLPLNLDNSIFSEQRFDSMLEALKYQPNQPLKKVQSGKAYLGKVGSINDNLIEIYTDKNNTFCLCEGDLSISKIDEAEIVDLFPHLSGSCSKSAFLPYLYRKYRHLLPEKLTGNFNIFCFDSEDQTGLLFNGRFGMLPLYYYSNSSCFVFASKLAALIKSGLVSNDWDYLTQFEQIIFNYPLSDHSLIKDIKILPAGSKVIFERGLVTFHHYWRVDELFGKQIVSKKESFESLYVAMGNVLKNQIEQGSDTIYKIGLSLTGGWDGRLVLSYFLNQGFRDKLLLYSFGGEGSTDLSIPDEISKKIGIEYHKIVLDKEYIKRSFILNAQDTIVLSNGNRPFLRTHYLHTMKLLSEKSKVIFSGNCGSNILKYGVIRPGTVINLNLLNLIQNRFSNDFSADIFSKYKLLLPFSSALSLEEFIFRMSELKRISNDSGTLSQFYFNILLSRVERKFFGIEQNSYNDFVYNFSPFIDYNFINSLSETVFWGANYPFNSNSLRLRKLSTDLYSSLLKRNSELLWNEPTDRGVSFKDLNTVTGVWKILRKKFLAKQVTLNKFNTVSVTDIFNQVIDIEAINLVNKEESANYLSTEYYRKWLSDFNQ